MPSVERSNLKPHCDSGQTLSASFCSLFRTSRAKTLPTMLSSDIPLSLLRSLLRDNVAVSHVLRHLSLCSSLEEEAMQVV